MKRIYTLKIFKHALEKHLTEFVQIASPQLTANPPQK